METKKCKECGRELPITEFMMTRWGHCSEVCNECVQAKRAFKAGASWRINSVWHKTTLYGEDVQCNVEVIAHCKNGSYLFGRFGAVGSCHEYLGFRSVSGIECAISDILEYAYLDDLLPDGKEDRNG